MRNLRIAAITVLLVAVLGLSACSATLPSALNGLSSLSGGILPRQQASTQSAPPTNIVLQAAPPTVAVNDLQSTLEQIYQTVNPSVVNIQVTMSGGTSGSQRMPSPFGQNPNQNPNQGVPQATAEGSGFVWDKLGNIVTNNHVVDGADSITVTFSDGLSLPAKLVGRDPDSDLAVISVDPTKENLQPVTMADSTQVKPGQFVVAIGNPFGLAGSMSFGIVSAVGRSLPTTGNNTSANGSTYIIPDVIQTDAPVNPGNSGGVLLDLQGNLVGVPSAIESSVRSSSGVGLAIPSVIVQKVVPALIQNGVFVHPYVGISGTTLTSDLATAMNLPATQHGALVVDVTSGSPAEKAGLQGSTQQVQINGEQAQVGGDVIISIDGQPVKSFEDLTTYLARYGTVGQTVNLTILRNGSQMTVPLTFGARPGTTTAQPQQQPQPAQPVQPQPQPTQPAQPRPTQPAPSTGTAWLGVSGITLTSDLAQAMNLPQTQTGALIEQVTSGSPADKAGLLGSFKSAQSPQGQSVMVGGDVITAVDGNAVQSIQDLVSAIQAKQPGDQVQLTVLRNGNQMQISVTLGTQPAQ